MRVLLPVSSARRLGSNVDGSPVTPRNCSFGFPALANVRSIRLITTSVPNTRYNVTAANGTFDYTFAAVNYTVVIPPGFHSASTLSGYINTATTAAVGAGAVVATFTEYTGLISIVSTDGTTSYNFTVANSAAAVLGVAAAVIPGGTVIGTSTPGVVVSGFDCFTLSVGPRNVLIGDHAFSFVSPVGAVAPNSTVLLHTQQDWRAIDLPTGQNLSRLQVRVTDDLGEYGPYQSEWSAVFEVVTE